jgi:amidophosphoribosyltransferase
MSEFTGGIDERPPDIVIADQSELQLYPGLHGISEGRGIAGIGYRDHYVRIVRMFIYPTSELRHDRVRIKFNPVKELLSGKRVVVVDDSIVRGTTSKKLMRMLRDAGATEIHVRISSPPIRYPCFYGIDTPTRGELIAANCSEDEIRKYLEVDSLGYLSVEGMLESTGLPPDDFCVACFRGDYPVAFSTEPGKLALEHFGDWSV